MRVCMCVPEASGMIWALYDWLNKFYSFCMVAAVDVVSRRGLCIDFHSTNQPNRSKLELYKPSIHI